jgi:WhiB family transcriptional regulator, redox-sensing transcriptional regulator
MSAPDAPDERLTLEDWLARPAWHQRALCRGETPAFFSTAPANLTKARAMCGDCPVRQECLDVAVADDSLVGFWGGTTELERREMLRGRVA